MVCEFAARLFRELPSCTLPPLSVKEPAPGLNCKPPTCKPLKSLLFVVLLPAKISAWPLTGGAPFVQLAAVLQFVPALPLQIGVVVMFIVKLPALALKLYVWERSAGE